MIKKIGAYILILVLMLSLIPQVGAAVTRDAYAGFVLYDPDGASQGTNHREELGRLSYIVPGAFYWYEVDFGDSLPATMELKASAGAGDVATVSFYLDAQNGPLIGQCTFTGEGYNTPIPCEMDVLTEFKGTHTIYMKIASVNSGYYSLKFVPKPDASEKYTEYGSEDGDVFRDIADSPFRREINFIAELGFNIDRDENGILYPDTDDGMLYPEFYVSRGRFARAMSYLLGDSTKIGDVSFTDVPKDHRHYESICKAVSAGFMSGYGDGTFNPDGYITVQEAAASVCKMLGYKNIAERNGGYPGGYLKIANQNGMLKGIDTDGKFTNENFARFIENILHVPYYEISMVTGDGDAVYTTHEGGILSKTRNIYYETGLVDSNTLSKLNSPNSSLAENIVTINGNTFDVGTSKARFLLGYECGYFYKVEDGVNVIVAIAPQKNVEITTISSKDYTIKSISASEIVYYEDGADKDEKLELENCNILYNNVSLDALLSSIIKYPFKGTVRYVDNPSGKDTLLINQYVNIEVKSFNDDNRVLYDAISNKSYNFGTGNCDLFLTKDGVAAKAYSGNIRTDDRAVLFCSVNKTGKKFAHIVIGGENLVGVVTDVYDEDEVRINGHFYRVDTIAFDSQSLPKLSAGDNYNFYLNTYGEIVGYDLDVAMAAKFGYYFGSDSKGSAFNKTMMIRLMPYEGDIGIYDVAKGCVIDGNKCNDFEKVEAAMALAVADAPVRYVLNDKNQVVMLDTLYQGTVRGTDAADMIKRVYTETSAKNLVWSSALGGIMDKGDAWTVKFMSNDNADVFNKTTDEAEYMFAKMSKLTLQFAGELYSSNENEKFVDLVVTDQDIQTGYYGNIVTVADKTKIVDEEGNVVTKLYCYNGGTEMNYFVYDDLSAQVDALQKGDVIHVRAIAEKLKKLTVVNFNDGAKSRAYTGGTLTASVYYSDDGSLGTTGPGSDDWQYTLGVVTNKYGDMAEIAFISPTSGEVDYMYYKINMDSILMTKYNPSVQGVVSANLGGTTLNVGDVVSVSVDRKMFKGVHVIENATLANRILSQIN